MILVSGNKARKCLSEVKLDKTMDNSRIKTAFITLLSSFTKIQGILIFKYEKYCFRKISVFINSESVSFYSKLHKQCNI